MMLMHNQHVRTRVSPQSLQSLQITFTLTKGTFVDFLLQSEVEKLLAWAAGD